MAATPYGVPLEPDLLVASDVENPAIVLFVPDDLTELSPFI